MFKQIIFTIVLSCIINTILVYRIARIPFFFGNVKVLLYHKIELIWWKVALCINIGLFSSLVLMIVTRNITKYNKD